MIGPEPPAQRHRMSVPNRANPAPEPDNQQIIGIGHSSKRANEIHIQISTKHDPILISDLALKATSNAA